MVKVNKTIKISVIVAVIIFALILTVYGFLAREKITACNNMLSQAEKDECYYKRALTIEDKTLCEKIEGMQYRNYCYANIALIRGETSLCESIPDTNERDNCYLSLAKQLNDRSICNKIFVDLRKGECLQILR